VFFSCKLMGELGGRYVVILIVARAVCWIFSTIVVWDEVTVLRVRYQ